jgi:3-hydroxyacyl-CoA dehydrogenase/enoyl-CoA hydratase/carnithine racemase
MGGGLELALSCEARTLSEGAQAVAFPEVFLSIVPGWGGTQLTPRLVGAANALKAIVENPLNQNRTLRPHQAFELGLADRLLPALDFFEDSLGFLEDLVSGAATVRRTPPPAEGLDELFAGARRMVEERVHGATQAPGAAIDLVEFAARGGDLEEGLEREADALGRLLAARQAQAAVYAFGLTQQRVKRQPGRPQVPPREVRKVGIVGAGLMGRQLGSLYLQRMEVPLVLVDLDEQVLAQAREAIEGELTKRVQRGRLTEGRARFLGSLVQTTTDYDALTGSDLVVEAVVEVLDVKRRIFADAEAVTDPGCVFATNTSSLSVAAIAEGLQHPERVVGLHFFNPVAVLPLVEVVRGDRTSDEALATAFEVGKRLGKSAVACADTPAFVVNRLLTRFMSAAGEAVRRGNRFTEVDDAVKALGLPMGPFELLGLVGPEVNAHVVETLHEAFPDRFPLDENMTWLARSGLPGVYDWARGRVPYEEVAQRWQRVEGGGLPEGEIRTLALEAVADEARRMLDEGVVPDARDIDTCMLLGAGFPFFNGGICKYLDQTGVSEKLFGATLLTAEDRAFAR